ncbi:cytochrome P450 [Mycobacterium sp.]|uniref:cytochrome P450 n=1 Tax=Mycobacterium sp. TaxID=1785 RepID=UPI0031E3181E
MERTRSTSDQITTLHDLPRARLRSAARDIPALLWPGAANSPLSRLGERVVLDVPLLPPLLLTSSVADARALLIDADADFSFGQVLRRLTAHDVIFGTDTLSFLEGAEHRAERKTVSPPYHGRALKSYEDAIAAVMLEHLDQWPVGEPISFLKIGYQLSVAVMMSVVFGVTEPGVTADLQRALHGWFGALESPGFQGLSALGVFAGGHALPYLPLRRHEKAVDAILLEEIADRRAGRGYSDSGLIEHVLQTNAESDHPKDDAVLARELRGTVLAGYETTAVTLSWIAEFVSHSPRVLSELRRSVDAGDDSYLDAVICEVMRLRPAVPGTARRALRDTVFNGIHLPKGTVVVIPFLAVHERPDIYDDPLTFLPERFLDTPPGTYTWLPFGAGAHRCLGAKLATFEARVLFRTLLQHRSLTALPGPPARAHPIRPMLMPVNRAKVVLAHR